MKVDLAAATVAKNILKPANARVLSLFLLSAAVTAAVYLLSHPSRSSSSSLFDRVVLGNLSVLNETRRDCDLFSCFDVYKCGRKRPDEISVYVYPHRTFSQADGSPVSVGPTKEFWELLVAITESRYFTDDPKEACLFVPSFDLLNQLRVRPHDAGQALASYP